MTIRTSDGVSIPWQLYARIREIRETAIALRRFADKLDREPATPLVSAWDVRVAADKLANVAGDLALLRSQVIARSQSESRRLSVQRATRKPA